MIIEINADYPEPRKVRRAVEALNAGEVIAYPTDTLYALGCDMLARRAIDRLYQLKSMPRTQQLALICPDLSDIAALRPRRRSHLSHAQAPLAGALHLHPGGVARGAAHPPVQAQDHRHPRAPEPDHRRGGAGAGAAGALDQRRRSGRRAAARRSRLDARWPDLAVILDGGWGGVRPPR